MSRLSQGSANPLIQRPVEDAGSHTPEWRARRSLLNTHTHAHIDTFVLFSFEFGTEQEFLRLFSFHSIFPVERKHAPPPRPELLRKPPSLFLFSLLFFSAPSFVENFLSDDVRKSVSLLGNLNDAPPPHPIQRFLTSSPPLRRLTYTEAVTLWGCGESKLRRVHERTYTETERTTNAEQR